jgi:hypothetical protein
MRCHSRPPRSNSPSLGTPERSSTNTTAYAALTGPPTTPRSASSATFTKGFNPTLVRFCHTSSTPRPASTVSSPWFDFAVGFTFTLGSMLSGFNPTLVRFCRHPTKCSPRFSLRFNRTLVRFCHQSLREPIEHRQPGFNPTLVRFCHSCFNPTMVRLLLRNIVV